MNKTQPNSLFIDFDIELRQTQNHFNTRSRMSLQFADRHYAYYGV